MPVCDKQFYGHEAPDDRLAEDDRVILKAGDEEQDEDDLAQKLDDAGQQGQHLLAHALQSVAGGEQHSQHGVEGCVPDQIRAPFSSTTGSEEPDTSFTIHSAPTLISRIAVTATTTP